MTLCARSQGLRWFPCHVASTRRRGLHVGYSCGPRWARESPRTPAIRKVRPDGTRPAITMRGPRTRDRLQSIAYRMSPSRGTFLLQ